MLTAQDAHLKDQVQEPGVSLPVSQKALGSETLPKLTVQEMAGLGKKPWGLEILCYLGLSLTQHPGIL